MNRYTLIICLSSCIGLYAASNYEQQAQAFGKTSDAFNQQIKAEAMALKQNPTGDRKQLDTLLQQKQQTGATSRPQALSDEEYMQSCTARMLEQKRQSGASEQLTEDDVAQIRWMAMLAKNQRG